MDNRIFAGLATLALVLSASMLWQRTDRAVSETALGIGSEVPELWSEPVGSVVLIGWAFRTEDCLSCVTPAAAFRQIGRKYGSRVKIAALAVGEEPEVVKSFLRRERLDVDLAHVNVATYRTLFGSSPLPAIYVAVDGVVVAADLGTSDPATRDPRLRILDLEKTIDSALNGTGLAVSVSLGSGETFVGHRITPF
jgi:hypothetical protein